MVSFTQPVPPQPGRPAPIGNNNTTGTIPTLGNNYGQQLGTEIGSGIGSIGQTITSAAGQVVGAAGSLVGDAISLIF